MTHLATLFPSLPSALAGDGDAHGTAHRAAEGAAAAATWIGGATAHPEYSWAGWILLLPLLSAVFCFLCGAFRVKNKLPALVTIAALGSAFGLVLTLYLKYDPTHASGPMTVHLFDWIRVVWGEKPGQSFVADWSLYIDGLTLFWMLFVTGLGTLIAIFASEYMESDVGGNYCRFFGAVGIFLFAMGSLVMGGNLALLYLGWEGVGVASYLLIGYYYGKPTAVAAAKKAFVMNRVGDLGLLVGIYLTWRHFGSIDYATIFKACSETIANGSHGGDWTKGLIPYFLMLGAFGKSAQIPLFTWLPDAMEGPTPVSALIHAATMVTAGVYLIARLYPLFLLHPHALHTVAWIGGLTAFLAATIGMMQYDMKRVFAYSTVSQLGYMFLGLGVGTTFGACYHVFTHAFFKALLFLASGAVMHGFAGQLDIRKISGLRNVPGFKIVAWTMLIGCLWLSALPFTAAFFSKDTILLVAMTDESHGNRILAWLGLLTALMTAYYTFRVWFRVCGGETAYQPGDEAHGHDDHGHDADHGHGHGHSHGHAADAHGFHPHAPRFAINGVLLLLAVGAILAGLPGLIEFLKMGPNWAAEMIAASSATIGVPNLTEGLAGGHAEHAHHATVLGMDGHTAMFLLSTVAGFGGIAIAAYYHLVRRRAAETLKQALLANPLIGWLPRALENKWYVDELYDALFRYPIVVFGGHVLAWIDRYILDGGIINGIARIPAWIGRLFQPLYNGLLQGYAITMVGGIGLILAWIVYVWMKGGI
ncbi:MAG: NADH-quinone oxidoreductase subunit L [Phycisphaerae bacterium]|nr:NADH-quinone oxidoreductase subunit L [Phycisphaerae bacterium]